jgi:hypothetical protein
MLSEAELDRRFSFHAPATDARRDAHTDIRRGCRSVADFMNNVVPDGREKSIMYTKLEEVMFWANAALARQHDEDDD